MLAENKNDLLTREKALKKIWGSDTYFNGRSMDVYIAKLRKYLKEDEKIEIVKGVTNMGYTAITFVQDIPSNAKIVTKGAFFINAKLTNTGGHEH